MRTQRPASGNGSLGSARIWRFHDVVVVLLLVLILSSALSAAFLENNFGIEVGPDGGVTIRDFASHLKFAQTFWGEQADYSTASHVAWTNRWAGQEVDRALPFGYSPTMLWILAPFCTLPLIWGYAAWSLCGAAAVGWMTRRCRTLFLAGPLVLLGPLGVVCFALGQTAFLTAAAIMFLAVRQRAAVQRAAATGLASGSSWAVAGILWALTAKPPLAIVAGVGLLATRKWRPVVWAVGLAVVSTLLLTPKLGADWVHQYVQLMTHYDRETADAAFAWSLRPDHMTNLRGLIYFSGALGDTAACRISSLVWIAAMIGIVTAGLLRRLSYDGVWGLSVLAYLLFCPHVTSTEDLHLIVLIALVASTVHRSLATDDTQSHHVERTAADRSLAPHHAWVVALLVLAATTLAPENAWVGLAVRSYLVFGVKLVLAGLLIGAWGTRTSVSSPGAPGFEPPLYCTPPA